MRIEMELTRWELLLVGLAAWVGLSSATSCSSDDHVPGGGRVEHPAEPGPAKAPPPPSVTPPPASAAVTQTPSADRSLSLSEVFEQRTGIKLSPLDKAIAEDCPKRAWSKNVPKRRCTTDSECGDGFCDRDRCAPLWSCFEAYSRPCERDDQCALHLCIDGRCRSCTSDAECERLNERQSGGRCTPASVVPDARQCIGVVGSVPGTPARGPLPQRPKQ